MARISLLCFGSIPAVVLHLPPSLTCRNERQKILEHEPNISLPRLPFRLFRSPIRKKMKIDMQNRSNVHFHAFLMCSTTRRSTWMNRAKLRLAFPSNLVSSRFGKIKNDYFPFFLYRHRFGNQKPFTILEARLRIAERKVEDVRTSRKRRENSFLVGERKETYFSLRLLNTPCSRTFFLQSPICTADTTLRAKGKYSAHVHDPTI